MTEKYELPEFESDEERERYFRSVVTLKQEYINNMVTFLFVNSILRTTGNDKHFIDEILDRISIKFKQQMLIMAGTKIPSSHVDLKEDLDVQNILDGIVSNAASVTIKQKDPIFYTALNNVCEVYKDTLKQAFDSILNLGIVNG